MPKGIGKDVKGFVERAEFLCDNEKGNDLCRRCFYGRKISMIFEDSLEIKEYITGNLQYDKDKAIREKKLNDETTINIDEVTLLEIPKVETKTKTKAEKENLDMMIISFLEEN